MKNPLEIQSAEKKFLVDQERLDEIKMQEQLFLAPIEFFTKVRQGYLRESDSPLQADKQFMDILPLLVNTLRENYFNLPYTLPAEVTQMINGSDTDEKTTEAVISILKNVGVTKEGARSWIINDFAIKTSDFDSREKIELTAEKSSQLQLIEKIYGNN
jgi:hypothetical protein